MTEFSWTLLELVLPLDIWLRTDLHALPHLALGLLLLAVVGALAIAIVVHGATKYPSIDVPMASAPEARRPRERRRRQHARREAPCGGAGARAPGSWALRTR